MLKVFTTLLAVQVVWGFPGQQQIHIPKARIVGGHDANIEDYPYQLALLLYNQHYCGAALIQPDWAVTAAHCVDHGLLDTLAVRAGSSIKSSGGEVINVSRVIIHPNYDEARANYDIAVLQLEGPVTAENAVPIRLPQANETAEEGDIAVVSGWGTLEYDGETPDILQVVQVPVVAFDTCRGIYGNLLTEAMLCAGLLDEGGKDACQGDAGGPLVIDGRLAGTVSWGNGCATPSYPGVYVNVAVVVDWILEQLNGPSSTTEPGPSSPSPGPSPTTPGPSPPSPGPSSPSPSPEPTSLPPSPPSPGPSPTTPGPSPPSPGPSSPSPEPSPGPSSPSPGPSPGPSSPSPGPSPPSPGPSSPSPGPSSSSPSPPSPPPSSSSPVPEPPTTVEPDTPTPESFSFSRLLKLFRE